MFGFLKRAQSITKIAIDPPAEQPGRAGLALVLIVRNEAVHIDEWARFHLRAGVRHIVAYDNGCTDGTIAVLRQVVGDALTVVPWNQKFRDGLSGHEIHNQVLAYAHATRNFGGAFRWMSYLDADEFLVPKGAGLNEALAGLEGCRNISLPWHMFGRSGHMTVPEGGVVRNYTRRNPDPMSGVKGLRNFKMIVDPCHVTAIKVHVVETDGSSDTCNDQGTRFSSKGREKRGFYSANQIQLNHYYTRSDAELQAKIARGPNLTTPDADHLRRVMRKVANIEAGEVEDRAAVEFLGRMGAPSV
ncbi:MAG: glycosyltransferase family 92 protein [Paracoccaceae bacterium]